ncbi:MAG: hypothetical protein LJE85_09320 [Gammaproteobacteria bacterium]|jgi:hypothetical protein|nr:hypothetical protein [Gammaproteobacteria bacterium]
MKTKLKISAILTAVTLVSAPGYSAESITGAFGIAFGTLLKDVNVIESHVNSQIHNVQPPKPMSLLRFYTVDTTGDDKKIYRITGLTLENNRLACLEDLATITSILQNKYGQSEQGHSEKKEPIFRFLEGKRSVIASCDQEGGDNSRKTYKLKVTYEDRGLVGGADAL